MSATQQQDRTLRGAGLVMMVVGLIAVAVWVGASNLAPRRASARHATDIRPAFVLTGLALAAGAALIVAARRRRREPDTAGSAAWATRRDVRDLLHRHDETPSGGLTLGTFGGRQLALDRGRTLTHVLVLGPTGSGKTRSIYMPNLGRRRSDSYLVTDTKGELHACCARYTKRVRLYEPLDPDRSEPFNWIPRCADADVAMLLGRALAMQRGAGDGKQGDSFWTDAEALTLAALFAHASTMANPTPATAYELVTTLSADDFVKTIAASPSTAARGFIAGLRHAGDSKVRSGVLIGVMNALGFLADDSVRRVTSATSEGTDFSELRRWSVGVYWVLPHGDIACLQGLSSLFFNLFMHDVKRTPGKTGVTVFLDEAGNVGRIPDLAKEITLLRGLNIAFVIGLQALSQLEATYGRDDARTIWNNCCTWYVLAGLFNETAETVSRILGETTVLSETEGWSRSQSDGWLGRVSRSVSGGAAERARRLATGDEVRRWPKSDALVVHGNLRPMRVRRIVSTLTPGSNT